MEIDAQLVQFSTINANNNNINKRQTYQDALEQLDHYV